MYLSLIARARLTKGISLLLALVLLLSSSTAALASAGSALWNFGARICFQRPAPFRDAPSAMVVGKNPKRDEKYRGWWNDSSLQQVAEAEQKRVIEFYEKHPERLLASLNTSGLGATLFQGGLELGGDPLPWEGSIAGWEGGYMSMHEGRGGWTGVGGGGLPGFDYDPVGFPIWVGGGSGGGGGTGGGGGAGGSESGDGGKPPVYGGGKNNLNTNTGNMMTVLPLVGWTARGDQAVDFTIVHNSRISTSVGQYSDMGAAWSHSYSIMVDIINPGGTWPPPSTQKAILTWSDGLKMPWTYGGIDSTGAYYTPPPGVHGKLWLLPAFAGWKLLTKDQWIYNFNGAGYLTSTKDRYNNTVTINRNSNNEITTVADGCGRTLGFSYVDGKIAYITDPTGRQWVFSRNGTGQLTQVRYPLLSGQAHSRYFTYNPTDDITAHTDLRGKNWTYTYTADGKLLTATNPLNKQWSYTYGSSQVYIYAPGCFSDYPIVHSYSDGLLVSVRDEAGFVESYNSDSDRNLTDLSDRRGKVWHWTYDSQGNMLTATDPLSRTTTATYNSTNDLLTVKDALNNQTTLTRDPNSGNVLTVTDPLSHTVATGTYNAFGELEMAKDAYNHQTTLTNDTNGNVTDVLGPDGTTAHIAYDTLGRPTSSTDSAGFTTSISYDDWGRVTTITPNGVAPSTLVYDLEANITSATDALNRSGSRTYDDAGRLLSATNANSETTNFVYSDRNFLTGVTNARGYARTYTYTVRGEVYTLTLPDNSVESWQYDADGNTTAYTNAIPQTIGYVYNDAGDLTTVDYPTGTDTSFGYDAAGRSTSMADSTGTSSWTLDAASQLTQLTTPQGVMSYTYNLAGQPLSMVETGVGTTTYAYDSYGRPSTVTNPYGETTTLHYDSAGRVDKQTNGNGTTEEITYDSMSRPTSMVTKAGKTVLASRNYTFNAVNNITQIVDGAGTTSYTYDNIDQLLSETRSGYSCAYTYDANGNRLTRTLNGVMETYSCDAADKLTSVTWTGGSKTYGYDAAGRTNSVTTGAGTTNLAYDYEGRVTSITYPNSSTNTNTYNGLDTRVGMTDSAGSKTFKRNGIGVTSPVLSDGLANYTPGLSERRSGSSTFYHGGIKNSDAQSSIGASLTAAKQYDAFGNLCSSAGNWNGPFGYGGGFGYQSDADSGLKLLGHRYYDSGTGRFLSRDPAGAGRNWFSYCENSPILGADPDGQFFIIPIIIGAIILLTAPAIAPGTASDVSPDRIRGYKDDMYRTTVPIAAGLMLPACASIPIRVLVGIGKALPRAIKRGSQGGGTAGKGFSKATKAETLNRNPDQCVYCRMKTERPQVDHAIPKARGGDASLENAQTTCPHCNASKGSGMFPKSPPPNYRGPWPPPWWRF